MHVPRSFRSATQMHGNTLLVHTLLMAQSNLIETTPSYEYSMVAEYRLRHVQHAPIPVRRGFVSLYDMHEEVNPVLPLVLISVSADSVKESL